MVTNICSRGFALTAELRRAVDHEVHIFRRRFSYGVGSMSVRLSDVNGPRGGADKVCSVQAHLNRDSAIVVATDIDANLYRAVSGAFRKLKRSARGAQQRVHSLRRHAGSLSVAQG